jgi:hypothetical protein
MKNKVDVRIRKKIYRAKHRKRINKYARDYYQKRIHHFRVQKRNAQNKHYHKDIEKSRAYQRKWNKQNRKKASKYITTWRNKNRAKHNAWRRENYRKNKEKMRAYRIKNYWKNPEKQRAEHRIWYRKNVDKVKYYGKKHREINKLKVVMHYGKGKPECACCGEKEMSFLTIDHINGGGNKHRAKLGNKSFGGNFYKYLIDNNFPINPPLQVLCYNCNLSRSHLGYCPHKKDTNEIKPSK